MPALTIRLQMLRVVIAALLPLVGIAIWQWSIALDDSRTMISTQLRATAWGIAETERDPFVIAKHSLHFAAEQPAVRRVGRGCDATLGDALKNSNGITNFVRSDANGLVRCSVLPFTKGQDLSGSNWWLQRRGRSRLYLAEPQIGDISQQLIYIMVLPMYTEAGVFDGTLSAGISIRKLGDSLIEKSRVQSGIALVTDKTGKAILTTSGVKLGRLGEIRQAQFAPQAVTSRNDSEWTYVSAPLFRDELYIAYAEPSQQITRWALSRMWPNLLLLVLALVLTSFAIWYATHSLILRWLTLLQKQTAKFARGDFGGNLEAFAGAPSELADFASDLHTMANSIDRQNQKLRQTLVAKDMLTREVNHRVKNNLQIVNSMLSMHADRLTEPAAAFAIRQARTRVAAFGLVHRLFYESDSDGFVGMQDMHRVMTELCALLRSSHRNRPEIELECSAGHGVVTIDQAVPLGLFVVEAVSNAFQHAFDTGVTGQISISFEPGAETADIVVTDNGHGIIESSMVKKMGMELVYAYAQQLGGTVVFQQNLPGTSLRLRFPFVRPK